MKNKSYDKKIFRLIFILNKLNSGKLIKTSELAKEFNVTVRTVQRDFELLNMTGFPLVSSSGGYKFMEGFSLQKIAVTSEEKFLLNAFYDLFSRAGAPFDSVVKKFLNKTLSVSKEANFASNQEPTPRQKTIITQEIKNLSKSLPAKLEDSPSPSLPMARYPPSTKRSLPVIKLASSLKRNAVAAATSSTSPSLRRRWNLPHTGPHFSRSKSAALSTSRV